MKRADSLLAPLIKNLKIEDAVRLGRIREGWQGIFEKPVSLHTYPSTLKEGELLINVDSPAWLQQLSFYKEDMAKKLHSFGVKVVRFRVGRVSAEKRKGETIPVKRHELTEDDRSFVKDTLSLISDDDLKKSIKKAMEKAISTAPEHRRRA